MKVRDIAPFGVRMPSDLKEMLEREAKINNRSLNSEVIDRLKKSLERQTTAGNTNYVASASANSNYTHALSDPERQFIGIFRRLPVEKQLALLSLFK
jgi:ABC-type taurine transport system ATPase subunit